MSNSELLKLIIREKPNENTSELLLKEFPNLPELLVSSEEEELQNYKGIGKARAAQIKAVSELAKRLYSIDFSLNKVKIGSPRDAADFMTTEMQFLTREEFRILILNTKNEIIGNKLISVGSLSSSIVHPRECYLPAVKLSGSSIICFHNHPSGDPTPSCEDISITKRLQECGKLIGIDLVDHIIIGYLNGQYISLKERGIL